MSPSHPTPPLDLAPITRHLRAMYGSRLLIAAVCHLRVFEELAAAPLPERELRERLGLAERPAMVLLPALLAMGLLERTASGDLQPTSLGRYLNTAEPANLVGYVGLEADDAGVLDMVERLRHDGPAHGGEGTAYVKEGHEDSPMDHPQSARYLTLALAGRARYLSPLVVRALPRRDRAHLLDVAGGTGLFTYGWLLANPSSTATLLDRPEVLRVAAEFLQEFARSGREGAETVPDRVSLLPGDMLEDRLPAADLVLAASVFHDWPADTCQRLASRLAAALDPGGEIWVHDAFLDDTLDGPLAVTDYSAQLFWVTRGRAYSRAEVREWLSRAGLDTIPGEIATGMDYGLIGARKT
jgi:hypothetical protein